MDTIKNFYRKLKEKLSSKEFLFTVSAIIMTIILLWFSIANFIFVINKIQSAFTPETVQDRSTVEFDINSFRKLNLIQ